MFATVRYLLPLFLLTALVGCQSTKPQVIEPVDANNESTSTAIKEESGSSESNSSDSGSTTAALSSGTYCYQLRSETEDIDARMSVDSASQVTGESQGVIRNAQESYYSSYSKKVNGTVDGSNLNLNITKVVEGQSQPSSKEVWKVKSGELTTYNDRVLAEADCAVVDKAFQNEGASLPTGSSTDGSGKLEQVKFGAGKSGTTVSGSLIRGDRDTYILNAQSGQEMDLSISSLEDNAVFEVVDPEGSILGSELKNKKISLPSTGDYQIVVGGTRGNASYDLKIAIK